MSKMMIVYEGRLMSTEEVLRLKEEKTKPVIETPSESPTTEETPEVKETVQEDTQEVIADDELEIARAKYKEVFGRKAQPNAKLETLQEKIAQASEA